MCGIVGYVGKKQAAPILLNGLKKLEYRGYDSAGVAVRDRDGKVVVVKTRGKLMNLREKINDGLSLNGCCGIGHTRWATHGEPSVVNAHPHVSDDDCVVGVHNGIIENFRELKEKLLHKGYTFYSQTDTEVLVKLIDYYYKKYKIGPIDALAKTMVRVRGSYALAVMFKDYPGAIYVARKDSPMVIGVTNEGTYLASDVPAILDHTRDIFYIDNLQMACLTAEDATFYNLNGDVVQNQIVHIDWDAESAEKGGYAHFMMKEICDQPLVAENTIRTFVKNKSIDLGEAGLPDEEWKKITQIIVVACGSAFHAGVVLQYVAEDMARIPVRVELASEFRYRNPILTQNTLIVAISQSGETADTLAALRLAKKQKIPTLAIVNVVGSSIAREADKVLYTKAGPEISVATTKAYSAQLIAGYAVAMSAAKARGYLSVADEEKLVAELSSIPEKIKRILEDEKTVQWLATKIAARSHVFFVGRGIDYAICKAV